MNIPSSGPGDDSSAASRALQLLLQGNRRFAAAAANTDRFLHRSWGNEMLKGQRPHAIVLGCSDSRVPVEIVFDQGFGDLFVIRVAGNVVQPSQIGSVEFAAAQFGTRLVVVLGHTHCGAVQATIDELRRDGEAPSRGLRAIVDRIRPAVEPLLTGAAGSGARDLERLATRANVEASVRALSEGSEIIRQLISDDGLLIVGAEYSLETGLVTILDHDGG